MRADCERRAMLAHIIACSLPEDLNLYASESYVINRIGSGDDVEMSNAIVKCQSHWDASLVLIAYSNRKRLSKC